MTTTSGWHRRGSANRRGKRRPCAGDPWRDNRAPFRTPRRDANSPQPTSGTLAAPSAVLDLYAEFRGFENGRRGVLGIQGTSLLAALAYFGLSHLDPDVKAGWRERILQGRPYAYDERAGILDYCASDVTALQQLLPAVVSRLQSRLHWIEHALLRGRYMAAAAAMEHRGVPISAPLLERLN